MQKRNNGLDGLRWFAVTLVILSHCDILKQGAVGNCIFFTLSGFLAILPFVENGEDRFAHPGNILKYYAGRFLRIVPVFWVCLIAVWLLMPYRYFDIFDMKTDSSLILNLLFIRARKHLWFLQQEIVFYLMCPFILLLIVGFKKLFKNIWIRVTKETAEPGSAGAQVADLATSVLLALLAFVYYANLHDTPIKLMARERLMPFELHQFLIGMAFGYIYRVVAIYADKIRQHKSAGIIGSVYMCLFVLFCILSSRTFLVVYFDDEGLDDYLIGWEQPMLFGCLSGIFIILLLVENDGWFARALGNRFTAYLGRISFEMYILHVFFLKAFDQPSQYRQCVLVYSVTIAVSIVVHNYVEKPCIRFAKNLKFKDVVAYYKCTVNR